MTLIPEPTLQPAAPDARAAALRRSGHRFEFATPTDERAALARAWFVLAVGALVGAGLFSLLLVAARTPGVAAVLPGIDFFHVALVVHVDLSVLVWFAAMAGVLWSLAGVPRGLSLGWAALGCGAAGTLLMAAAPFVDPGAPVMSNYVPVLESRLFLAGLVVFGAGLAATTLRAMALPGRVGVELAGSGALRFGVNAAAVSAAVAVVALVASWFALRGGPAALAGGKPYYELLFWGPGHVLQFTWTLLLLVAWLWLATLVDLPLPLSPRVAVLLLVIALAAVFATPAIYLAWPVDVPEHQRLFTWLMRFGGGLAIGPVVLALLVARWRAGPARLAAGQRPLHAALWSSVLLFGAGGVIGFLIQGSDVRVPAHYHGSIVGVTLALMGVGYALLPRLGWRAPASRAAAWQPWVYGAGQLLHIVGLVWSGGYGVQRKVAGAAQVLRTPQEVAGMGLMGFGGLVAVIGGLMFVVIVLRAMRRDGSR
jgi:hypothetical protein